MKKYKYMFRFPFEIKKEGAEPDPVEVLEAMKNAIKSFNPQLGLPSKCELLEVSDMKNEAYSSPLQKKLQAKVEAKVEGLCADAEGECGCGKIYISKHYDEDGDIWDHRHSIIEAIRDRGGYSVETKVAGMVTEIKVTKINPPMNKSYVAGLLTPVISTDGEPEPDQIRAALLMRVMTAEDWELAESLDDPQPTDDEPMFTGYISEAYDKDVLTKRTYRFKDSRITYLKDAK